MVSVDFADDEVSHSHEHEHESSEQHTEDDSESDDAHSELEAEYRFHCDFPNELRELVVKVFDHLLSTETIRVSVVGNDHQKALDLHPTGEQTLSLIE